MENQPRIGAISSGTTRNEDLFEAFLEEAKKRFPDNLDVVSAIKMQNSLNDILNTVDSDDEDIIKEKFYDSIVISDTITHDFPNLLDDCLPPFMYFGANPCDGAEYGYWFSNEMMEDAIRDKTALKVFDLSEVDFKNLPEDVDTVVVVSDHGNVSVYGTDGKYIYGVV